MHRARAQRQADKEEMARRSSELESELRDLRDALALIPTVSEGDDDESREDKTIVPFRRDP